MRMPITCESAPASGLRGVHEASSVSVSPLTWTVMKAASALDKYEAFLSSNVSTISTLESSLRSLTWFLPGRFKDAELVSEAESDGISFCASGSTEPSCGGRPIMQDGFITAAALKQDPDGKWIQACTFITNYQLNAKK